MFFVATFVFQSRLSSLLPSGSLVAERPQIQKTISAMQRSTAAKWHVRIRARLSLHDSWATCSQNAHRPPPPRLARALPPSMHWMEWKLAKDIIKSSSRQIPLVYGFIFSNDNQSSLSGSIDCCFVFFLLPTCTTSSSTPRLIPTESQRSAIGGETICNLFIRLSICPQLHHHHHPHHHDEPERLFALRSMC